MPASMKVWRLHHWTARESPYGTYFRVFLCQFLIIPFTLTFLFLSLLNYTLEDFFQSISLSKYFWILILQCKVLTLMNTSSNSSESLIFNIRKDKAKDKSPIANHWNNCLKLVSISQSTSLGENYSNSCKSGVKMVYTTYQLISLCWRPW